MSSLEIPVTGKKDFINAIDRVIQIMKEKNSITCCYEHTVICENDESDVWLEFWDITFNNFKGNAFKANIKLGVRWKDGTINSKSISRACETWNTKKEFLAFLERECDK